MSLKTISALVITIVMTVLIMQNTEPAVFTIFNMSVTVPKLAMLTGMSVGGFLLGILITAPRRRATGKYDDDEYDDVEPDSRKRSTLSDEDRDYIS